MVRRCLVHCYAPQNIFPAVCAVRAYGASRRLGPADEVVLLLCNPGWSVAQCNQITPLITKLIATQGWRAPMFPPPEVIEGLVHSGETLGSPEPQQRFRDLIGYPAGHFQEVYYAHDVVGNVAQLCMRSFPAATHLTYGESMGLMEDKAYVLASVTGSGWDEQLDPIRKRRTDPEATVAVLILPADQTGECLKNKELIVVPRATALEVLEEFQRGLPDLNHYIAALLSRTASPRYVFAVNNLADAEFMTAEEESSMYAGMIEAHAPNGATVLIKGHPLAKLPIDQMVAGKLGRSYRTEVLPAEYNRVPLELWKDLLTHSTVIAMSYCSISIEYLFRIPVIYSIDTKIIERYMSPRVRNRFVDGDEFFRMQRERLETWDGTGVLCSGKRISFPPAIPSAPLPTTEDRQRAAQRNQEGIALFQQGRSNEALAALMEAHSLEPTESQIVNNIGAVLWNAERASEAALYFSLALSLAPGDRAVTTNLVSALQRLGQYATARGVCLAFLKAHPEDLEIRKLLQ